MRIDLPSCNFKNCKYSVDGNCVNPNEYDRCEFTQMKQQKIVRCKDCKYYAEHPRFKMKLCFQHLNPIAMPENGFCNYGEENNYATD